MEDFLKHSIMYEIQRAKVCPYRLLFDDYFVQKLKDSKDFLYSNIYFFCVQKKIRFNLEKTELLDKRTLKTELILGNSLKIEVISSFYDLASLFKSIYRSKDEYENLVSDNNDFWDCKLVKEESDDLMLVFQQLNTHSKEKFEFVILPENFEYDLDVDFKNPPEIIYIGQSFRMLDRIQSHKTLHKAVSKLKSDQELKIFFLTFKFGYGGHKDYFKSDGDVFNVWLSEYGMTNEFKSKIDLVERFLIHYFKPLYNRQHVDCEIQDDSIVKRLLLENKIQTVSINYGMYGNGFQFWSPRQEVKGDFCSFNFNNPESGYYSQNLRMNN